MFTFDIKNVNLVVGGQIITGFAEGSVINAEKLEDNFSEHVGVKGEVTIAETNNETGEITVNLKNTSPSVSYLNSLANKKGESAIVDVAIVDLNTNGTQISGSRCRVRKPADVELGNEETEREFVIFVSDYTVS